MRNLAIEQAEPQDFDAHEEFVQIQNNCTLCGASLRFEYEIIEQEFEIVEKCDCPSCGLRTQDKLHSVH